ncbi:hypothetical protein C8J56DRAFT_786206, partial [Mycena floridula]
PHKTFTTMPIGPQLQAPWCHPDTARKLRHCYTETQQIIKVDETKSIKGGSDHLYRAQAGDIKEFDDVLILSGDGGQLYRNKESSTYMGVCIICQFDDTIQSPYPLAAQLTSLISEKDAAIIVEWRLIIGLGEIGLLK